MRQRLGAVAALVVLLALAGWVLVEVPSSRAAVAETPGALSGSVTSTAGVPLADVAVFAFGADNGLIAGHAISAVDGTFSIAPLPPARYKVLYEPVGARFRSLWYPDRGTFADGEVVTVPDGATAVAIDGVLAPQKPVQLGSPASSFGNNLSGYPTCVDPRSSCAGPQPQSWAAVQGPYTRHEDGDPYGTKCPGITETKLACDSALTPNGATNAEYDPDAYLWAVDVPAGAVGTPVTVQVYDPVLASSGTENGGNVTGDSTHSSAFNTSFEMFDEDRSGLTVSTDASLSLAGRCADGPGRMVFTAADSNNSASRLAYRNKWFTLCTFTPQVAGVHPMRVKTSAIPGLADAGGGFNAFSVRATGTAGLRVYAVGKLSTWESSPYATSRSYLGEIGPEWAGSVLDIDLYDPGDGAGSGIFSFRVLGPPGGAPAAVPGGGGKAMPCTYNAVKSPSRAPDPTATSANCSITTRSAGTSMYNDGWLRVSVQLPADYWCSGDCWWTVARFYGGTPNDRTVMSMSLRPNLSPVPNLLAISTHHGSFARAQTGAAYTLAVSNVGAVPTAGPVTLTDTLPPSLTATSVAGPGWSCSLTPITCSRSDPLLPASSYPPVILTVDVARDAPAQVTNTATVSGGGDSSPPDNIALDVTDVVQVLRYTVDTTVDAVDDAPGDGVCHIANGGCSLRAAVQEVNATTGPGEVVLPPASVFPLTLTGANEDGSASGDLDLLTSVTIEGNGSVVDASGIDRVFQVTTGGAATLRDLTIRGGSALDPDNFPGDSGGGILAFGPGSLALERVTVTGNRAAWLGGGLATAMARVTITDSTFDSNDGPWGGGVLSYGTNLAIDNSTLSNNSTFVGGGVFSAGPLALTRSRVTANRSLFFGGGVAHGFTDAAATIRDTRIDHNTASKGGGVMTISTVDLAGSTIDANTATSVGGGVVDGGVMSIASSTISSNTAPTGGGIEFNQYEPVTLGLSVSYATVTGNHGGGIHTTNAPAVSLTGSAIVDQAAGPDCASTVSSGGFNADSDSSCALAGTGDITTSAASLGPLQSNGGITPTHLPAAASALTDAGGGACAVTDQRGQSRPSGPACDIGAVEAA